MSVIDPRSLCQIEIMITDRERSVAFYSRVFGWTPVPADIHEFIVLNVSEDCPWGISLVTVTRAEQLRSSLTTLYFAVASMDQAKKIVTEAEECGGRVISSSGDGRDVPGYGRMWVVADPDGQRWGLFLKKENGK